MNESLAARRRLCIVGGMSGIIGVILLGLSFAINTPPPLGASGADLVRWGEEHYATGLWGAWLQAVGPVLLVLFVFTLVHVAGATQSLAGWMTIFGAAVLMTVSLIEITFYISAWFPEPEIMPAISLRHIAAVQHLYFIVAAPALFWPLGFILISSRVLPRAFGYAAFVLAVAFAVLGARFMLTLALPTGVTACGGVQALWWLAAALTLLARRGSLSE